MSASTRVLAFLRRAFTRPRVTVPLVTLIFALVAVIGLGPVIQGHDLAQSQVAQDAERALRQAALDSKRTESITRPVDLSWLTTGTLQVVVKWDDNKKQVADVEARARGPFIRADRLALLVAAWLLATLLLALGPSLTAPTSGPGPQQQFARVLAETVLEKKAELARTQAQSLYSRSTALLLGGILIAFLGVVVFYLTLPEDSHSPVRTQKVLLAQKVLLGDDTLPLTGLAGRSIDEELYFRRRQAELERERARFLAQGGRVPERVEKTLTSLERFAEKSPEHFAAIVKEVLTPVSFREVLSEHLARTLRPFGILIFIEGIAWFLLRQYRALMEDYKTFHRTYLRRVNVLVAYKLLFENPAPTAATATFVGALFSEDLSGRLKKDETSEHLEGLKAINEPNPIQQVVNKVVEKLSPIGGSADSKSV